MKKLIVIAIAACSIGTYAKTVYDFKMQTKEVEYRSTKPAILNYSGTYTVGDDGTNTFTIVKKGGKDKGVTFTMTTTESMFRIVGNGKRKNGEYQLETPVILMSFDGECACDNTKTMSFTIAGFGTMTKAVAASSCGACGINSPGSCGFLKSAIGRGVGIHDCGCENAQFIAPEDEDYCDDDATVTDSPFEIRSWSLTYNKKKSN